MACTSELSQNIPVRYSALFSDSQNILGYSPVLNLELHYEAAFKEIHTILEGTGEAADDKFWPA
jgi:hypothetical protein